jgi:muconolactone D-isomerase
LLFHVAITVRTPLEMDLEEIKRLGELGHERAAVLQRQGKWLHLRRIVGQWANISIFRVESPRELHEILESLPLHPFMETKVTALCRHPGSIVLDAD